MMGQERRGSFDRARFIEPNIRLLTDMLCEHSAAIGDWMVRHGRSGEPTLEDARLFALDIVASDEVWKSDKYTVAIRRFPKSDHAPAMIHLSIKANDRSPCRDWREFQRIKNELLGPEFEAVELYPAESRLVDSANQYHLWALADEGMAFPFGFGERFVVDHSSGGAEQRPFDPAGCLDPFCPE